MNKLTLLPFLTVLLISCDPELHKFPHEREPAPPTEIAQATTPPTTPSTYRAPAPVQNSNSTAAFLTPQQDNELPTKEQLADGAHSSIGTGGSNMITPNTQPSTAIKPPTAPEDDLAPSE